MTSPIVYRLDPFSDTGGGGGAGTALDSIADLRAYAGSDDLLYIRAWHAGTFVGGGVFQLAVDDFSTDDSGSVIVDALSRRWRRQHEGTLKAVDFGAYADGNSDDGDAINFAADWLRANVTAVLNAGLDFEDMVYVTTRSFNFTAMVPGKSKKTFLLGAGARVIGKCAGKAIFDCLGSSNLTVAGIIVIGDPVATPRFGFQIGRYHLIGGPGTYRATSAGGNTFVNCGSEGTFTGGGKYNNGSEVSLEIGCNWYNDSPLTVPIEGVLASYAEVIASPFSHISDSGNHFDVQSDYVTVTQPVGGENSFLNQTFINCSFRRLLGGSPLYMSFAQGRVTMTGCYAACVNGDAVIIGCNRYNADGGANYRTTSSTWNLGLHIEADSLDETTSFLNAFRYIPQDNNGGTLIALTADNFTWIENKSAADESLFRMSSLFPASSRIVFRGLHMNVDSFHGSDAVPDGGAPNLGIFYPGIAFRISTTGYMKLPISSGGPVINDTGFYLSGDFFPRSATTATTVYPKGSYRDANSILATGSEYHKGRHVFWGDMDTSYIGTDFPPTSFWAFNNGTLTSAVPGGGWSMSQDVSGNFSLVRTVGTGKLSLNGAFVIAGTGAPEGVVTATVGTIFERTDGSFATSLYIKTTGVGNTGWLALIPNVSGNGTATGTGATSTLTLAKLSGVITTDAITTAAGASHVMTVTNSLVAVGDSVAVWRQSDGTNTRKIWAISSAVTGASTFTITIDNNELANAINGTLKLGFLVVKAA